MEEFLHPAGPTGLLSNLGAQPGGTGDQGMEGALHRQIMALYNELLMRKVLNLPATAGVNLPSAAAAATLASKVPTAGSGVRNRFSEFQLGSYAQALVPGR